MSSERRTSCAIRFYRIRMMLTQHGHNLSVCVQTWLRSARVQTASPYNASS